MGDLNSRISTPTYNQKLKYAENPDSGINPNGKTLLKWLACNENIHILNGLFLEKEFLESNFTFYLIDLILSNASDNVISFKILERSIYSDHCPVSSVWKINTRCPLHTVKECSAYVFNDEHLGINKRRLPPIKFSKIDWAKDIPMLEMESHRIFNITSHNYLNNESLYLLLSNAIYDTCKRCYKREHLKVHYPPHARNCNSKNFKAPFKTLLKL